MIDDLAHMANLSTFAVITIFLMCLICGFMVGQLLNTIPATILIYFAFAGAAYFANLVWRHFELSVLHHKDLDAVLATTVGLIGAIFAFVIFKLLTTAIYGQVREIPKTDLDAVESRSSI